MFSFFSPLHAFLFYMQGQVHVEVAVLTRHTLLIMVLTYLCILVGVWAGVSVVLTHITMIPTLQWWYSRNLSCSPGVPIQSQHIKLMWTVPAIKSMTMAGKAGTSGS